MTKKKELRYELRYIFQVDGREAVELGFASRGNIRANWLTPPLPYTSAKAQRHTEASPVYIELTFNLKYPVWLHKLLIGCICRLVELWWRTWDQIFGNETDYLANLAPNFELI